MFSSAGTEIRSSARGGVTDPTVLPVFDLPGPDSFRPDTIPSTVTVEQVARMPVAQRAALLAGTGGELDAMAASVARALDQVGACLVRGVPTTDDTVLALLATGLGELVPTTERPVGYLEDVAPVDETEASTRPHSQRRSALMPHTDQSARGTPPDFLVLACVANECDRGGESILVFAQPVVDHLGDTEPDAVDLLQDPVFPLFNVPKRDFAVTAPLLWFDDERRAPGAAVVRTRFRDEAVRAGFEVMHRPSAAHVAAFEALAQRYHDETRWVLCRLDPGDVLVVDNTRVLHGRTELRGGQRRHLRRLNGRYRGGWATGGRAGVASAGVR
jgi:hypothetical protein